MAMDLRADGLQRTYFSCISDYGNMSLSLFTKDGHPKRNGKTSLYFWLGFNGDPDTLAWTEKGKRDIAYAAWCAGRKCAETHNHASPTINEVESERQLHERVREEVIAELDAEWTEHMANKVDYTKTALLNCDNAITARFKDLWLAASNKDLARSVKAINALHKLEKDRERARGMYRAFCIMAKEPLT